MDLREEAQKRGRALRILVTRLRYLGDVILTTPAIALLKERYPDAEIHYLTEAAYAPVLEGNPHLDGIVALHRGLRGAAVTIRTIRQKRFAAAIDLFYNPRSAMLLYMSRMPIRVGGSRRWRRRMYTHNFSVPPGIRSAVDHHIYPLGIIGANGQGGRPRVYLSADEHARGTELLDRLLHGERSGGLAVAIHPGGTWQSKRWESDSFIELARGLVERLGARILVVAGPGEEAIAREIKEKGGGNIFICPLQTIRTLASLLDNCDAVVANDGGVLHLSAALGRPTVGIFGPTEPDIWFPYEGTGPFRLVTRNEECAPCHLHECDDLRCLRAIEPASVMSAVEEVLRWKRT
jgi:lipopolysaccharide heptosyltransferase II